jgi:transketolase
MNQKSINLTEAELLELVIRSYESRKKILKMMRNGSSTHLGGAFSCIDLLTVIYNKILRNNPLNPKWKDRDRFILSAGHKAIALYTVLQDKGYFNEKILWTFNKIKSPLPEHPDEKTIPGIEFPTGSLGHGLSAGLGMALAARIDNSRYRVFVLLGEGECAEGTVWEAIIAAGHFKLDNLVAIVDRNNLQVNGPTKEILDTSPLEEKFQTFKWEVRIVDGHNFHDIYKNLSETPFVKYRPSCLIADTVKGKGIKFAEGDFKYHHCHLDNGTIDVAITEIEKTREEEIQKIKELVKNDCR